MHMKRLSGNGFTIVESLMVLVVSGALLASVTVLITGQQGKAQFKSAMTDVTSKLQQTINEASTGYYPSGTPFSCQQSGATFFGYTVTAGATEQGANEDCIYIGRAMMFGVMPKGDPETYLTHTIVGRKQNSTTGREVTSFTEAGAQAVAGQGGGISVDLSEENGLLFGLKLKWMRQTGGAAFWPASGIAFVMNPGNASYGGGGGGQLQSGAQQVTVVPILSGNFSETGRTKSGGVTDIWVTLDGWTLLGLNGREVRMCFESGTTEQSGLVKIGSSGGSSAIDYTVYPNTDCTP